MCVVKKSIHGYLVPRFRSVQQLLRLASCSISSKFVDCLRATNKDLVEGNVDFVGVSLCRMWEVRGGREERTELDKVANGLEE